MENSSTEPPGGVCMPFGMSGDKNGSVLVFSRSETIFSAIEITLNVKKQCFSINIWFLVKIATQKIPLSHSSELSLTTQVMYKKIVFSFESYILVYVPKIVGWTRLQSLKIALMFFFWKIQEYFSVFYPWLLVFSPTIDTHTHILMKNIKIIKYVMFFAVYIISDVNVFYVQRWHRKISRALSLYLSR